LCTSEVNAIRRASNVGSPVVLIDGILLIGIDLEEPVVAHTLEVLVADIKSEILPPPSQGVTYEFNFWKFA
jgi:hypothetical protein